MTKNIVKAGSVFVCVCVCVCVSKLLATCPVLKLHSHLITGGEATAVSTSLNPRECVIQHVNASDWLMDTSGFGK